MVIFKNKTLGFFGKLSPKRQGNILFLNVFCKMPKFHHKKNPLPTICDHDTWFLECAKSNVICSSVARGPSVKSKFFPILVLLIFYWIANKRDYSKFNMDYTRTLGLEILQNYLHMVLSSLRPFQQYQKYGPIFLIFLVFILLNFLQQNGSILSNYYS
jgi:hypothetical protein